MLVGNDNDDSEHLPPIGVLTHAGCSHIPNLPDAQLMAISASIFVLVSRNVSGDIHYTRKVMMGTLNTTRKIGSPTKYKLKIRSK